MHGEVLLAEWSRRQSAKGLASEKYLRRELDIFWRGLMDLKNALDVRAFMYDSLLELYGSERVYRELHDSRSSLNSTCD